ncbi:hypothetical protein PINS_up003731 [Pythium insidiosum]|nr:hypothetical protein PINS_up003731 [Pythium insidiosum]
MGFGAPFVSSHELNAFLSAVNMTARMVTLVNEHDCIPGILNVAQATAMFAKTTERFMTVTKATKTLLRLLPASLQRTFVGLSSRGGGLNATSAYLNMSLNMLQNTFQKFRETNIVKELDYCYAPCGSYLFMKQDSKDHILLSDTLAILQQLQRDDEASTTLTGNAILQHLMSAYVDAVARRSTSIQINESMNYYERLGISRKATKRQVRSAYKALALKWHPDRWSSSSNPREKDMAEQVFKLLAEAYEVLSDPEARQAYDDHLDQGPSVTEEFVRHGTVRGMSLDEAISTFQDVLDGTVSAISRVSSKLTSSSSSVAGQQRIRRVDPAALGGPNPSSEFVVNNHNNLFAPDRVRITRKINIGTEQHERIMYVQPDEVMPGDIAAPTRGAPDGAATNANAGVRAASVLGGAVVVGASVALAVSAWSHYSESAKRQRQAEAVRSMPGQYLMLLMQDTKKTKPANTPTIRRIEGGDAKASASENAIIVRNDDTGALATIQEHDGDEDDELLDEFYECMTDFEDAALEAFAEDEFFECVEITEAVAQHFDTSDVAPRDEEVALPEGSSVMTPMGLGVVVDWRPHHTSAVIRLGESTVGFIQKKDIQRGATVALVRAEKAVEDKRCELANRIVTKLGLEESQKQQTIRALVSAGKDGALDSGIRAAGGIAIAKGMARTSTRLGGAVAAPLTIASILVDIGKDYYEYRQKHSERKNLGVLSKTSERLMMQDFRLRAGKHVVSGTAAAAGASVGAYSVAATIGFWTGVGITGPVGVVAATGAAVVGGVLGFFAGSKAYNGYTEAYFTSYKTAKEHIDRLELGARILFDEHDPNGSGEIGKEECIQIMSKLYEASGAVSDSGFQSVLAVIQDERFEGPVSWAMFWDWVSSEAAKALQALEDKQVMEQQEQAEAAATKENESWWKSYLSYYSYGSGKAVGIGEVSGPQDTMYPSVRALFKISNHRPVLESTKLLDSSHSDHAELVVLRAQMEYLVNAGVLTETDAFQLEQLLLSSDESDRESARKTISTLHAGEVDSSENGQVACGGIVCEGFTGDGADEPETEVGAARLAKTKETAKEHASNDDEGERSLGCALLIAVNLRSSNVSLLSARGYP